MDLNKHIVTNDTSKPFHSNGFARVVNGDRLGASGSISFEQRQLLERNRKLVAGYRSSSLGNTYGVLRAKTVAPTPTDNDATNRTNPSERPTLQQHNSIGNNTPQGYNPYS